MSFHISVPGPDQFLFRKRFLCSLIVDCLRALCARLEAPLWLVLEHAPEVPSISFAAGASVCHRGSLRTSAMKAKTSAAGRAMDVDPDALNMFLPPRPGGYLTLLRVKPPS